MARSWGAGPDSEDVAQEALLRAASHPSLDPSRARSYVAKIAANLVIDLRRQLAKDKVLRTHTSLAPTAPPADEEVEDRDLARQALQLLSGMDAGIHAILVLRRNGATWSQVGEQLGEAPATAEMRYRRAMTPLRRRLSAL